jgi:hypothetical protein
MQADLLLGRRDRLARLGDLRLDLGDRAFELFAALEQRLDKDRVDDTGLLLAAAGPRLLLDFPVQPLRVAAQPGRQCLEPGEKAAPFMRRLQRGVRFGAGLLAGPRRICRNGA